MNARGVLASIIAFDLTFAAPSFWSLRVFWYLPLARRWWFGVKPTELGMDWYGRTAAAIALAVVAFMVAHFMVARTAQRMSGSSLALWTGWAAIATTMTLALQVFQLVTRHPIPEPLPSWYVPR